MQDVERAIFDLRRGLPVVVDAHDGRRLVAPIEGLSPELLTDLFNQAEDAPRLLLTNDRLRYVNQRDHASAASLAIADTDTREQIIAWACAPEAALPATRPLHELTAAERAGLDLAHRSLLVPAAVSIAPDARCAPQLEACVAERQLLAVAAADVARHRAEAPGLLRRVSEADVPLEHARYSRFVIFREPDGMREHVAILIGASEAWDDPTPVRLHSACLTGDLFGSLRCDCGPQLRASVRTIAERGGGVLLYLAQEGRGIGLANKMRAYQMQDDGLDTVDADQVLGFDKDERDYAVAREMLAQLDVSHIELLTNNPAKLDALDREPIRVAGRSSLYGNLTTQNRRYLTTKAERAGHWLDALLASPDTPPD
ncbi:GTP cyclohydrolase II [Salinisphaera sp. Q1T1-3]|uniref:GTP cyclohydrolase II n=1 Tax=Salinisphaera sp. Q1T1-3 TaxID=2321229 RepID=UPI000E7506BB|nr:GTP cyclohydrolase II [Salinisphaera sp. Q1T1-3]RJS92774.1 GTP cyclohydrolase II RibA [Salinisphaera sp. Q1T1-3]